MMAPIRFGQIVWVELPDANGIRKLRPAIVVTPGERIRPSGPFEVVAVTSQVPQPLPDDHVLLPWQARTGLNRKCAAVCSWLARILPSDIQGVAGLVPGPCLLDIVSRIPPVRLTPKPDLPAGTQTGQEAGNDA